MSTLTTADVWILLLVAMAVLAVACVLACAPAASRPWPEMPDTDAGCDCLPCPGRGNDGHGMTHCAECCFGSGVEADIDCPIHGIDADLDAAMAAAREREADREWLAMSAPATHEEAS